VPRTTTTPSPRKGEITRRAILDHATDLASEIGLTGLTIGRLADDLEMSKSGLFAHFHSKEELQIQVLLSAAERFTAHVVQPALRAPSGVRRVHVLFERWMMWDESLRGGCIFAAAAAELDDRSGSVRERLVALQQQWVEFITTAFRKAIEEGHLSAKVDPGQLAQDLYGIMLVWHHHTRLLGDRSAGRRARHAFESLLDAARPAK
jgi:AcrR family transcriptional regulator